MKLKLNGLTSDILISCYVVVTLYYRFKLEHSKDISPFNSLFLGLSFVVIIWALIKLKVLNPNWFGLFKSKKPAK